MPQASDGGKTSWLIGTGDQCDIVLSDVYVSKMHCRLLLEGGSFRLVDLQSKNGTFVDGARLTAYEPKTVSEQSKIMLGSQVALPWDAIKAGSTTAQAFRSDRERSEVSIGRAEDNDIVVGLPTVSSHHARIMRRGEHFYIVDLNSLNGTSVNDLNTKIHGETPLRSGDNVFLGTYKVPAAQILSQFRSGSPSSLAGGSAQKVVLQKDSIVVGRDPDCDHLLSYPMISWRHARISRAPGGLVVEDLGSRNGTFVDGKRISSPTRVAPGQRIGLGSFQFELLESGALAKHQDFGFTIEARNLTFFVKNKKTGRREQLLAPTSLTIYAGEMVALMGTSGAGKTTLMQILNGYTPPTNGQVLYNGRDLYQSDGEYAREIGYVPQDDIVHSNLTVREALSFAARLRTLLLPDEIRSTVERIVNDLNLTDVIDKQIGSPENKGLSGGQRKRVNIGLELVCDTPILFLDEPTSGLSSADSDEIILLLKRLAREQGKTIVSTIHSPSLKAFREFDNLILLGRDSGKPGTLVYYGPTYPDSLRFIGQKGRSSKDPLDSTVGPELLMSTLQVDKKHPDPTNSAESWSQRYSQSTYCRQFVQERAGKAPSSMSKKAARSTATGVDFGQWVTLTQRNVMVRKRDQTQLWIQLLQAPIFALLIAGVFHNLNPATGGPLDLASYRSVSSLVVGINFLMVVAAIWFGCNNAVRDIVGEWLVYKRERMVALRLPSYVFSKLVVLSVVCLTQCLVMLTIVYFECHLSGRFWLMALVLWLTSMVGATIGLFLSAAPFCRTTESAIAMLPIVLLPMIGLGGGIRPMHEMASVATWTGNFIATRWAFEANLIEEAKARGENGCLELSAPPTPSCVYSGDTAEASIPEFVSEDSGHNREKPGRLRGVPKERTDASSHRSGLRNCFLALGAMLVTFIGAVLASLRWRDV